jgi:hypothetical protein
MASLPANCYSVQRTGLKATSVFSTAPTACKVFFKSSIYFSPFYPNIKKMERIIILSSPYNHPSLEIENNNL